MRTAINISTILLLIATMAFTRTRDQHPLQHAWVYESYSHDTLVYVRKARFARHKPGLAFYANGVLKVKQNASWCGTEPIDYEVVSGRWVQVNDSVIELSHPYYNGQMKERYQILSLNRNSLWLKAVLKH